MGEKHSKRKSRLLNLLLFGPFVLIFLSPVLIFFLGPGYAKPKPIDLNTSIAFMEWLDKKMLEQYGPPSPRNFPKAIKRINSQATLTTDIRFSRIKSSGQHSPLLDPDIEAIMLNDGHVFDQLDALFKSGHCYVPFESFKDLMGTEEECKSMTTDGAHFNNATLLQSYGSMREILAQKAAAEGNWEIALDQLNRIDAAANSICTFHDLGYAIATFQRGSLQKIAVVFLGDDVPVDIKRQAAQWLRECRNRMLHYSMEIGLQESRELISYFPGFYADSEPLDGESLGAAMSSLALLVAHCNREYDDPRRGIFANLIADAAPMGGMCGNIGLDFSENASPGFTYAFVKGCAYNESFVRDLPMMKADFWPQDADPVTKLIISLPVNHDATDYIARNQRSEFDIYLIEAALQAQIFSIENGHWPNAANDLVSVKAQRWRLESDFPVLLIDERRLSPASVELEYLSHDTQLHFGEIEVTADVLSALRSSCLPMGFLDDEFSTGVAYRTPTDSVVRIGKRIDQTMPSTDTFNAFDIYSMDLDYDREMSAKLYEIIALNNSLLMNRKLVESVQMYWCGEDVEFPDYEDDSGFSGSGFGDPGFGEDEFMNPRIDLLPPSDSGLIHYLPISETYIRELIDALDLWQWTTGERIELDNAWVSDYGKPMNLPPDKQHITRDPDAPKPKIPSHAILDIQWKTPSRIFAVWNGGPDGDDDGGQVAYDPTNGTVSNGDLIQFVDY